MNALAQDVLAEHIGVQNIHCFLPKKSNQTDETQKTRDPVDPLNVKRLDRDSE